MGRRPSGEVPAAQQPSSHSSGTRLPKAPSPSDPLAYPKRPDGGPTVPPAEPPNPVTPTPPQAQPTYRIPTFDPAVAEAVILQWNNFFKQFRDDEQDFELKHYRAHSQQIQKHLDALPEGHVPDLTFINAMLQILNAFHETRFRDACRRLELMISELRSAQGKLGHSQLTTAYVHDELQRCWNQISTLLKDRRVEMPPSEDPERPPVFRALRLLLAELELKTSSNGFPAIADVAKTIEKPPAAMRIDTSGPAAGPQTF